MNNSDYIDARSTLWSVLDLLSRDQQRARRALNLTPSENILSPLARLPFVLDAYSRYFFDHKRKFGSWCFYGALDPGRIEYDILHPILRRLARAEFVNAQPISGLTCMMVAIGGLTRPGETMFTVPPECGGHISTRRVAERFGVRVLHIPMRGVHDVDVDRLANVLRRERPALVYLDQSTQLFPIDPAPIREAIDLHSPGTLLHFDSSHINGLVLFGALPNPLEHGAHTFGGSTHKTLPGPHKGFLATRDPHLASRLDDMSDVFISHHHPAEVLSLTITLLELDSFDGTTYARRILENARRLALSLHERGVHVAAYERGFTGCHQVWVDPADDAGAIALADRLLEAGVVVNRLGDVPGFSRPVFRLSLSEFTRLGGGAADVDQLTDLLDAGIRGEPSAELAQRCGELRSKLNRPKFCFDPASPDGVRLSPAFRAILDKIESLIEGPEITPITPIVVVDQADLR